MAMCGSPASVLLLVLVAIQHCVSKRISISSLRAITREPAARFDARKWSGDAPVSMTLLRHGETVFSGNTSTYDFSTDDLHKAFIAKLNAAGKECTIALYVRGRNAPLCGTELFQRRSLQCEAMDDNSRQGIADLPVFEPASDRGFSVEFEFVARELSQDQWATFRPALQELFIHGTVTDHGRLLSYEPNVKKAATVQKVFGLRQCFSNATRSSVSMAGRECSSDADCALTDYCFNCDRCVSSHPDPQSKEFIHTVLCGGCLLGGPSTCKPRDDENEGSPTPLWHWNWEKDESVVPLSFKQAKALGVPMDQAIGDPFEITAPGPPNVLSGKKGATAMVEVLGTLRYMGIQAGPTQGLHVHVNVLNSQVPGTRLTFRGIISVWVAWAKYQLIINEMLSPGRVDVPYARPLIFGDCEISETQQSCRTNPCSCVHRFFRQMHEYNQEAPWGPDSPGVDRILQTTTSTNTTGYRSRGFDFVQTFIFCNRALSLPASPQLVPCKMRYPMQRYFQVNLVPLVKYGTMEFRPHSATSSPDRVGRWVQFILAFVDYFGLGEGMEEISSKYLESTWEENRDALKKDQQAATATDLFGKLGDKVDASSLDYFMGREYEKKDASCEIQIKNDFVGMALTPDCRVHVEKEVLQATVRSVAKHTGIESMQVTVPLGYEEGDYINVELPDGEVRTIRIPQDGKGGHHVRTIKFERNPADQTRAALLAEISMEHRCCCDEGNTCLWIASGLLSHGGKCPRIGMKKEGPKGNRVKRSCAMDNWCFWDKTCWKWSKKTSHSPGRCRVVSEEEDPKAYFGFGVC